MEKLLLDKPMMNRGIFKRGTLYSSEESRGGVNPRVATIICNERKEIGGVLSKFSPKVKSVIIAGMTTLSLIAGGLMQESKAGEKKPGNDTQVVMKIKNIDNQLTRLKQEAIQVMRAQQNGDITWQEREMQVEKINKKILILEDLKKRNK